MKIDYKWVSITLAILLLIILGWVVSWQVGERFENKRGNWGQIRMGHNSPSNMGNMMMGMTSGLNNKTGDEFDKAFLTEMIAHHQGAVDMAKLVLENSKRPELIKMANDIISAQTKEIETMRNWANIWFTSSIQQ